MAIASTIKKAAGNIISGVGTAFNLPEMGISEKLGYTPARQGSYSPTPVLGAQTTAPMASYYGTGTYTPLPTQQKGPQPTGQQQRQTTGNIGAPQQSYSPQMEAINSSTNSLSDSLNRDYEDSLRQSDTAEAGLRSQADLSTQAIQTEGAQTENALRQQQQTANEGLTSQENVANQQAKSSLQQMRDLYRQTQQQNIAQLSGMGISSSSVAEALAEKLGVESARRIAGVTGSLNEVVQNISKERARVNDFAATKLTELKTNVQNQIAGVQSQLLQGIRQIQDARQMAATAKANARANLLSQAQSQIANLQSVAQQYAQQMDQWRQQREKTLTDAEKGFTIAPSDNTALQTALTEAVTPMAPSGYTWSPTVETSPSGYRRVTPTLKQSKADITEEL